MIDFHTHILPNIDDGSRNIEETLELLREARNVGFNKVILTPHYIENYYDASIEEKEELLKIIQESDIPDIELLLANEIYMSDNLVEFIKSKKASTINNTRYVLFELPMTIKPLNLYDMVYKMLSNNLIPILAHPERYTFVQQDINVVSDLIEKGVLMQSNYGSFIGQYGKKAKVTVKKLLKNDMIHFLGTDVHRENTIYNKIPKILSKIEKVVGKEKVELITNANIELVLQNKSIKIM